jgi:hypothetical protein
MFCPPKKTPQKNDNLRGQVGAFSIHSILSVSLSIPTSPIQFWLNDFAKLILHLYSIYLFIYLFIYLISLTLSLSLSLSVHSPLILILGARPDH